MSSAMLRLGMPSHQTQDTQNASNPLQQQLSQPNVVGNAPQNPENQQAETQVCPFASGSRQRLSTSDEDDHGVNGDGSTGDGERTEYPTWKRMKWTDTMVRLLIMAVYFIDNELGSDKSGSAGKKRTGEKTQKKGKWKAVSCAMLHKGHGVSPQQCEDKFNDLNKRYKRLNDILGQGTACDVVANPSLLDTMDLPPNLKAEARKLLQSKHLYFKEMCAYYRNCKHGPGYGGGSPHPSGITAEQPHSQQQQMQGRHCLKLSEKASQATAPGRIGTEGSRPAKEVTGDEGEEEYEDNDSETDDEEDDEEGAEGGVQNGNWHGHGDCSVKMSWKRKRIDGHTASPYDFSIETAKALQDEAKSAWEKKRWIKMQLLQLEEQKVSYQYQAFGLEKQRLKWLKFSKMKEMELERAKLEIERKTLENQRMLLLVRQKKIELCNPHSPTSASVRPDS